MRVGCRIGIELGHASPLMHVWAFLGVSDSLRARAAAATRAVPERALSSAWHHTQLVMARAASSTSSPLRPLPCTRPTFRRSLLGRGGFSRVFSYRDERDGSLVAVKVGHI